MECLRGGKVMSIVELRKRREQEKRNASAVVFGNEYVECHPHLKGGDSREEQNIYNRVIG